MELTLTPLGWATFALCGILVGLSKTALPGAGILAVPLIALIVPAKTSVGLLLPLLIFADLFSAAYYRRQAQWSHLLRLLPAALLGILVGWRLMNHLDDRRLSPLIGLIVLVMLALRARSLFFSASVPSNRPDSHRPVPHRPDFHRPFAYGMGFAAGITTLLANAAGPVMTLYLLSMNLDKHKFVGTAAWFFFVVNWLKVPFLLSLGLMTPGSLWADLYIFPAVAAGALAGILLLNHIPQRLFETLAILLSAAAAFKLIF
jgi:hypothetical protein